MKRTFAYGNPAALAANGPRLGASLITPDGSTLLQSRTALIDTGASVIIVDDLHEANLLPLIRPHDVGEDIVYTANGPVSNVRLYDVDLLIDYFVNPVPARMVFLPINSQQTGIDFLIGTEVFEAGRMDYKGDQGHVDLYLP